MFIFRVKLIRTIKYTEVIYYSVRLYIDIIKVYLRSAHIFCNAFLISLIAIPSKFINSLNGKIDTSKVQLLNKVKIKNIKNGAVMTYTLVPENEANLKAGKISISTPIAKGLLGKKVGDKAEIKVPSGVMTFEIIEISI